MATIVANPYYDDPFLSSIASNISRAFIDRNPGQTAAGRAQARLYGLQADELETGKAARTRISQAMVAPAGPNGTHTPEQIRQMAADGIIGKYEAKELSGNYLFAVANSGQKTPIVQAALTATGRPLGDNQSVTTEQHDSNLARDERSKANVAGIGAGATIQAAHIRERGATERENMKDQRTLQPAFVTKEDGTYETGPDGAPIIQMVPKGDFVKNGGRNPVLPSNFYEKGVTKDGKNAFAPPGGGTISPIFNERMVDAADPNSPTGVSRQKDAVGVPRPGPNERASADISVKETNAMAAEALSEYPGLATVYSDGSYGLAPEAAQDPNIMAAIEAGKAAAAQAYGKTKLANEGTAAFRRAFSERLGIKPGQKFDTPNFWNRSTFGVLGNKADGFGSQPKSPVVGAVTGGTQQGGTLKPMPPAVLQEAQQAIAQGKPRAAIIQRLQERGFDPKGL